MVSHMPFFAVVLVALTSQVFAHIAVWDPSMFGFNQSNFATNRPQDPLANLTFADWWFHGHLAYPPHPNDIMQLPVGGNAMVELACDKGVTSWYASAPGGDVRSKTKPDSPCPDASNGIAQYHTNGINDLGGCALAVAYKSDANQVKPEDFVVFSVNHTCVWYLHTSFQIPEDMPPCDGKCICSWNWIHQPDSGSEQIYMNGFQCNFTNARSTKQLAKPKVARRCGAEPALNRPGDPNNCTYGAKSPLYWLQREGNNMFEGYYSPPLYSDLYNFRDGAQNDIFVGSVNTTSIPGSSTAAASTTPGLSTIRGTSTNPASTTRATSKGSCKHSPTARPSVSVRRARHRRMAGKRHP